MQNSVTVAVSPPHSSINQNRLTRVLLAGSGQGLSGTLVHNQHCRNKQYIPEQPIKQQNVKDIDIPLPDPFAKGSPHTVLGKKIGTDDGVIYRQSATFPADTWPKANGQGVPLSRVDWHDHSLPQHHPNPHQHVYRYNWQQHRWEMGDPTPLF